MLKFYSYSTLATIMRILSMLFLLALHFPAAAQAPAWQSARAVAVATAAGANNYSTVTATAVDAAGSVFLAGYFKNTVVLGGTTLTSLGETDVFVAKFNPASNQFMWAKRAGGTGQDEARTLVVSGTSLYVAGRFGSPSAGFETTTLTNVGSTDAFVAKLTDAGSTGSFVWAQPAGGTGFDGAEALAVSGTSVYVVGAFNGLTAGFGAITLTNAAARTSDVFVAKLTDAGSFTWAQRAGGTSEDYASALVVSGASVYVAGYFDSPTMDFGLITLTNASFNYFDVYVVKLTDVGSSGNFTWAQRAGGSNYDYATGLALSGTSVYMTGYFFSSTVSFGSTTLTNPNPNTSLGFLASLTDAILTATTAAGPHEPAQLFPNPARRTATLRLPIGTPAAPLVLTDALGRAARRYPAPTSPEATLDLRDLPVGLYLLRGAGPAQRLVVE